eukprot:3336481-Rhodomonas_salina.1
MAARCRETRQHCCQQQHRIAAINGSHKGQQCINGSNVAINGGIAAINGGGVDLDGLLLLALPAQPQVAA